MSFEPYVLLGVIKCYIVRKIGILTNFILFIDKNKCVKLMSKLMSIAYLMYGSLRSFRLVVSQFLQLNKARLLLKRNPIKQYILVPVIPKFLLVMVDLNLLHCLS